METVRFHTAQIRFFLRIFVSHLVGHCEQFGTHEKFPGGGGGCKIGLINRRPTG